MRRRSWALAVAALAVTGLVLRVVVATGRWATVDSDEAVVGLMARAMLDGEWRAFYWGQHYAGTLETALVALTGASPLTLKLVPAALSGVAAVLTWRIGRRFLPERVAQLAGLLTWVAPGAYVWWATKERGFYWVSLVLGLVLVLAAQRIVERDGRPLDWAVLGLSAGLGFWTSPTVAYFAVPAGLWILARRRPPVRWLPLAVPAALLGALPWLWHNLEQDWVSLDRPPQPEEISYLTGIGRLLWHVVPMGLNLRWPIEGSWAVPVVAVVVYLALGVLLLVRRPPLLLGLALLSYPFIYAVFPGAWFVGEGRYGLFALPFLALAVAWVVRRPLAMLAVVGVGLLLTLGALDKIGAERPEHVDADLAALRDAGVDHLWADYWLAYRLAFLSDGDLIASSHLSSRDDGVHDAVVADPTPAFLFDRADPRADALARRLEVPTRRVRTPNFVVLLADGPVDPADLPAGAIP